MRIGVTGTRSGMTEYQKKEVAAMLGELVPTEVRRFTMDTASCFLHHGDCVGVDVEVAQIAREFGYYIVCHPPEKNDLRGFFDSDSYELPKSYFARNRDIVDRSDFLFVVPYQMEWQSNGGTWYTHDYAVKKKKPLQIFWPEEKK